MTSIHRDMYLGEYCDPRAVARVPEGLPFAVGVIATIGLPQIILGAYGGIVALAALAAAVVAGLAAGLIAYRYLPYRMPRCVEAETGAQSPPARRRRLKKAA
ncbi:MAG TPA: hypothetical protein VN282_09910 [Pyrinomonadaceae bacterium]|nr:hypothetical protein [Pyrinomonadaceae bacterium]